MADTLRTCPVCGAGLPEATPPEGGQASRRIRSIGARKEVRIAALIGVAILVIGLIVAIGIALNGDADLRQRAESASSEADAPALAGGKERGQASPAALAVEDGWLFVTSDELRRARNSGADTWSLERSRDQGATWDAVMSGSGVLRSAALMGDELYFSLDEGGTPSTVRCQAPGGAFREFPTTGDVASLVVSDGMIVTVSASGEVGWLNPGSGLWHGLSAEEVAG